VTLGVPNDFELLAHVIKLYEKRGYSYVQSPWTCSRRATRATSAECSPAKLFAVNSVFHDDLVGSAEQSFVQMSMDGAYFKPGRKLVTCTPCFRDEEHLDDLHRLYFMKVEITHVLARPDDPEAYLALQRVIFDAKHVMTRLIVPPLGGVIRQLETGENSYDLNLNEIEVGSYGIRSFEGLHWVYGTGLALPRFVQAGLACLR
jgi:seryl-tRNA synthetase